MKILHLEASPGWGGQEIRILREAEGMRDRGHEVFFCVMKGGKLIDAACKAGFTVYPLNFNKAGWLYSLFRLISIIRKHEIEVVNTHSSLDSWIGGIAGRIAKRAIVRTRHLSTPIKKGLNGKFLYGVLADFVVTTCASIIPMICERSGKSTARCRSIPTGVDLSRIAIDKAASLRFRKALGVGEDDLLVGTACFMRSWKGIGDLLKAANILRDSKWVIIGGGHDEQFKQMALDLNLGGIVHFTGHLEDPFPAIGALDIFTLLSTAHEGVSQAILQAAFLSKPLIATATGGLGEVCIHNKTGIQVDPFSPVQVAQAVLQLRNDPGLRTDFGSAARRLVEERFTLASTIDQMEQVYASVVNKSTNTLHCTDSY